jgi:hypothetical protein
MKLDFYKMRLDHVEEAARRTRLTLIVSIIASISVLGATWNSAPFGLSELAKEIGEKGFSEQQGVRFLQEALMRGWVESIFVNVPLFGIRFSNKDAWLLGTLALSIISIWVFYVSRRENHLIGGLIRDAAGENPSLRTFVFYGICGTQVFATLTDNDSAFRNIHIDAGNNIESKKIVIAADLASIFLWDSSFRPGNGAVSAFRSPMQILVMVIEDGFACLAFFTFLLIWKADQYQQATVELLRKLVEGGWATISLEDDAPRLDLPRSAA